MRTWLRHGRRGGGQAHLTGDRTGGFEWKACSALRRGAAWQQPESRQRKPNRDGVRRNAADHAPCDADEQDTGSRTLNPMEKRGDHAFMILVAGVVMQYFMQLRTGGKQAEHHYQQSTPYRRPAEQWARARTERGEVKLHGRHQTGSLCQSRQGHQIGDRPSCLNCWIVSNQGWARPDGYGTGHAMESPPSH